MAAEANITLMAELTGLGKDMRFFERFSTTATPTAATHAYITQTTGGTAQALELGDVSTVALIIIKAITEDLSIDTSWVTPNFVEEIAVQEGEVAMFKPGGTVYVKNQDGTEVAVLEALVIGTT